MGAPEQRQDVLDTCVSRLTSNWTRKAACQRQCHVLGRTCICNLQFVHVARFEKWMHQKDTDDATRNIDHLLYALHPKMQPRETFPFGAEKVLVGADRCVLVFGILLKLGYGELIDLFYGANIVDQYLHLPQLTHQMNELRGELVDKNVFGLLDYEEIEKKANTVIAGFEKARWAFCHPPLTLHMDKNFSGSKLILPFCRYEAVNNKGGTATVFGASIQREFITDVPLAQALKKSLYSDKDFGDCFKLAIKSYSAKAKDIYEWEKRAFTGLRNDYDTPIVQCLGCFTHDGDHEKTYNLVLEYGEMDLDEYCADLGNIAPVRSEEIIRFWQSLFEVAKAIERVHQVSVQSGQNLQKVYSGWHADIKPDNILLVHGEFKLADFGFAKFAEIVENDKPPEQPIMGGTDTYGAPEFARAKRSETLTPVKQTIDTWSYGCVLSIAATWVVLGFQGIQQYQVLRTIANKDRMREGETPTDRFHDGKDVLPEIKLWHRYLSNHVRKADTTTTLVLKIIDQDLLKADPEDRLTSAKLCRELKIILRRAEDERKELFREGALRDTDVLVKRALLATEKAAHSESDGSASSNRAHLGPVEIDIATPDTHKTLRVTFNAPASQSKRVGKEAKMQHPLAKTAHREEILEEELSDRYQVSAIPPTKPPPNPHDSHNGARSGSSTNINHSPQHFSSNPYRKEHLSSALESSSHSPETALPMGKVPTITAPTPPSSVNTSSVQPVVSLEEPAILNPSLTRLLDSGHGLYESPVPQIICDFPEVNLHQERGPESQGGTNQTQPNEHEQTTSFDALGISTNPPSDAMDLPFDVCRVRRELESKDVSRSKRGTLAALGKNLLKLEDHAKDEHLAKFIHGRELIFVIDNGTTMLEHWPVLTFVAETLSRKVAGLDKSGIDVKFTVNGHLHNRVNLRGEKGRAAFTKALHESQPPQLLSEDYFLSTDMNQVFMEIFREWRDPTRGQEKPTTLIVLTDGEWRGTQPSLTLNNTIVEFGKEVLSQKRYNPRHFSIGFVRFGDTQKLKLEELDDKLCDANGLHDFIDQCSWKDTVYKMLLGSLDSYHDKSPDHVEVHNDGGAFEYSRLIQIFDHYNTGSSSTSILSPSLARSPSHHSSFDFRRSESDRIPNTNPVHTPAESKKKKRFSSLRG